MSIDKYIVLLCALCCLCGISCDLNLSEGSPCTTEGFNGTCLNIFKCESATMTYLFRNSGFKPDRDTSVWFSELPEICSYKNNEPVVCCTDCDRTDEEAYRSLAVKPSLWLTRRDGTVALDKCLDHFQRLPFRCRGVGALHVTKRWKADRQCHVLLSQGPLAGGGRDAQRWEFPHVALLGYGETADSAQWLCGGSIISEKYILTAAHCSSTTVLGSITFAALGLLKRTDPKKYWKIYKIKRIIVHPEFKAPSKYHDIALLETEDEINFGRDLLPACLHTGHQSEYAEASGWGRLGHRKSLADTLQVIYLKEFNETSCKKIYQPHRHLKKGYDHQKQMCYGDDEYIIDTCEGDSGGPLQLNDHNCLYTIIGVTSYGKDCGILGSAGMYTRVAHYVPWIESVVWPEETEARRQKLNKVKLSTD